MDNTIDNADRRLKIISVLFGIFGQAGDGRRIALYVKALKDIPLNALDKACEKLAVENKFLPVPAEIIEARRSLIGTVDAKARFKSGDEAWDEIERKMQATPWGHTPEFSTPEIAAAVFNFGWNTLQQSLAADMPTIRAQIRKMYEAACERAKEQSINRYILGGEKAKSELLYPRLQQTERPVGKVIHFPNAMAIQQEVSKMDGLSQAEKIAELKRRISNGQK